MFGSVLWLIDLQHCLLVELLWMEVLCCILLSVCVCSRVDFCWSIETSEFVRFQMELATQIEILQQATEKIHDFRKDQGSYFQQSCAVVVVVEWPPRTVYWIIQNGVFIHKREVVFLHDIMFFFFLLFLPFLFCKVVLCFPV